MKEALRSAAEAPNVRSTWRCWALNTHPDVALLAPVPTIFLTDGMELCNRKRIGKVAFGSRDFQLFRELDQLRGEFAVYTLIYASQADQLRLSATWEALYVRHVEVDDGLYPGGSRYRPARAVADPNEGGWGVYWEVTGLRPLDDEVPITGLVGWDSKKPYKASWPERPTIIERPRVK